MKTTHLQGRRSLQYRKNFSIAQLAILIILATLIALAFSSCSTTKNTLPFYDNKKYGVNPTKKCKNHNRQDAWIERQWKGEGR